MGFREIFAVEPEIFLSPSFGYHTCSPYRSSILLLKRMTSNLSPQYEDDESEVIVSHISQNVLDIGIVHSFSRIDARVYL